MSHEHVYSFHVALRTPHNVKMTMTFSTQTGSTNSTSSVIAIIVNDHLGKMDLPSISICSFHFEKRETKGCGFIDWHGVQLLQHSWLSACLVLVRMVRVICD